MLVCQFLFRLQFLVVTGEDLIEFLHLPDGLRHGRLPLAFFHRLRGQRLESRLHPVIERPVRVVIRVAQGGAHGFGPVNRVRKLCGYTGDFVRRGRSRGQLFRQPTHFLLRFLHRLASCLRQSSPVVHGPVRKLPLLPASKSLTRFPEHLRGLRSRRRAVRHSGGEPGGERIE